MTPDHLSEQQLIEISRWQRESPAMSGLRDDEIHYRNLVHEVQPEAWVGMSENKKGFRVFIPSGDNDYKPITGYCATKASAWREAEEKLR
jgi:hypothetical protein